MTKDSQNFTFLNNVIVNYDFKIIFLNQHE